MPVVNFRTEQDMQLIFEAALNAAADVARRTALTPREAAKSVASAGLAAIEALERGEKKD